MNSEKGGLSSSERQRKTAAEIARRKVLEAYEKTTVESVRGAVEREKTERTEVKSALKTSSTGAGVSPETWKKYHTAWQNYYQKYYSEYYSKAAKDYVAKERLKAESLAKNVDTGAEKTEKAEKKSSFKEKIRARASERAKLEKRRRKLMPLIAGVAVVLFVLFLPYNRLIFAPIAAYVSPGEAPVSEITAVDPTVVATNVSSEPKLIIPKLNVEVPIAFGVSLDGVMNAMNYGVVHYRINGASAYPGQIGNFVITGHSAGDIYSANPYKFIFSGLERLEDGDMIYVHYNSTRYSYKIVKKEVIEPTEVSKLIYETKKPMLTLITCTPLGTSRYRLLVTAEQVSPSYETAEVEEEVVETEGETLPENEETFFERVWGWLTGN